MILKDIAMDWFFLAWLNMAWISQGLWRDERNVPLADDWPFLEGESFGISIESPFLLNLSFCIWQVKFGKAERASDKKSGLRNALAEKAVDQIIR